MYMELPQGIETSSGNSKTHILQHISNLYRQNKQAEYGISIIWTNSLMLVDDGIFFGATDEQLEKR
ncbi:hypothetical protein ACHAXS_000669 [Conticribra weissflogii]